MRTKRLVVLLVMSLCLLLACTLVQREEEQDTRWHCQPVPDSFQESDLVGTWQAQHYFGVVTETLTLRADHTYQQLYENDRADYYYTGSWEQWYLEPRANGGYYLHLIDMHYCASTLELCQHAEGGDLSGWLYYEPCEDRVQTLEGGVILTIVGAEGFQHPVLETIPRGIILGYLKSDPDNNSDFFIFQE